MVGDDPGLGRVQEEDRPLVVVLELLPALVHILAQTHDLQKDPGLDGQDLAVHRDLPPASDVPRGGRGSVVTNRRRKTSVWACSI